MIRGTPARHPVAFRAVLAIAILGFGSTLHAADSAEPLPAKTALDDYVNKPDASYSWKLVEQVPGKGFTAYLVDMTSQTWRTPEEVDRPKWQHWLVVIKPDQVAYDTGFLFIGGGRNDRDPPKPVDERMAGIALATRSVTAHLRMVPNQPLVFHGDGKPRVEDDLVAYTWKEFLKTGDPTWPARNPMVKSAVRAMDTVTALMATQEGGKTKVDKYVVAGGSKRGWTTWLTGAVDDRVAAIVPIVIDVLNAEKSIRHHWAAYGFWAPAIHDYEAHGILARLDAPRSEELYRLVDPYFYRHRLKKPKYIVTAGGDQFFLPDSARFYFDDLEGEKFLRTVPNADHSLDGTDSLESIVAFYRLILSGKPRPEFSWTFEPGGTIRVRAKDRPTCVSLWQATNPDARDFRLESLGPKYTATELNAIDGVYTATVRQPAEGWTAYFVELTYRVGELPLKFTTPVRVTPDTLPFADKPIPTAVQPGQVTMVPLDDRCRVLIDGELFAEYVFRGYSRPIVYPIVGPYGIGMTRNWPMREGVPGESHDHVHQKAMYFAFGAVSGVNFFAESAESGKIVHQKILATQSGSNCGSIRTENAWIAPDGTIVCTDTRTLAFQAVADGRVIDWEVTLHASHGDVKFADDKHGIMAIRTHPNLRLDNNPAAGVTTANGQAVNSEGVRGSAVFGKRAEWIDYSGTIDGKTVGIAIFDHPSNPRHPTWWMARGYGYVAADPFGAGSIGGEPPGTGDLVIPAGESITLRYRFIFHKGDPDDAKIADHYRRYADEAK